MKPFRNKSVDDLWALYEKISIEQGEFLQKFTLLDFEKDVIFIQMKDKLKEKDERVRMQRRAILEVLKDGNS